MSADTPIHGYVIPLGWGRVVAPVNSLCSRRYDTIAIGQALVKVDGGSAERGAHIVYSIGCAGGRESKGVALLGEGHDRGAVCLQAGGCWKPFDNDPRIQGCGR